MFDQPRVAVVMRRLSLKIEEGEDGDRHRFCECLFRVPLLTFELAARIRLPILGHCFGRDHRPLWGIHEVRFGPPDETYTAAMRAAPDMEPSVLLELLTIRTVRVWRAKPEQRDLALEFLTRHESIRGHGDGDDLARLLSVWEGGQTWLTLEAAQIPLALPPEDEDRDAAPRRPH